MHRSPQPTPETHVTIRRSDVERTARLYVERMCDQEKDPSERLTHFGSAIAFAGLLDRIDGTTIQTAGVIETWRRCWTDV